MFKCTQIFSFFLLSLLCFSAVNGDEAHKSHSIVPDHEHALAAKNKMPGPTKSSGVESVNLLGAIALQNDFPSLKGRQLRARELVIDPGGVVAVHEHESRPGVAYILEGEIVEHRNDQPAPILRQKGAVAFEQSGVTHWWENKSDAVVRALVVDIVKEN